MPKDIKKNRGSDTITRTQPFAARIVKQKGKPATIVLESRTWFNHQISKFKDGDRVTLEIHNRKPKRTEQQNRFYWGVYLPKIAEESGQPDIDALHALFSGKFLTDAIVEVFGQKVRKKKSTTELGVGEFCQYMLDIETETGIVPPPTENYDLAPLLDGVKLKKE